MTDTHKDRFEKLWDDFRTLVKGKLLSTAGKQTLTMPLANLVLSDAASTWTTQYEVGGRWLMKLTEEDAAKAGLVSDVLADMKFTEVTTGQPLPAFCNYAIPLVGAGVGLGVAELMGLGRVAQITSVALPAILLVPAVNSFRKYQTEKLREKAVSQYVEQLDKYKNSIISILS